MGGGDREMRPNQPSISPVIIYPLYCRPGGRSPELVRPAIEDIRRALHAREN